MEEQDKNSLLANSEKGKTEKILLKEDEKHLANFRIVIIFIVLSLLLLGLIIYQILGLSGVI